MDYLKKEKKPLKIFIYTGMKCLLIKSIRNIWSFVLSLLNWFL